MKLYRLIKRPNLFFHRLDGYNPVTATTFESLFDLKQAFRERRTIGEFFIERLGDIENGHWITIEKHVICEDPLQDTIEILNTENRRVK